MFLPIRIKFFSRALLIFFLWLFSGVLHANTINQITHGECSPAVANVTGNVDIFCGSSAETAYWNAISKSENISDF